MELGLRTMVRMEDLLGVGVEDHGRIEDLLGVRVEDYGKGRGLSCS